MPIAATVLTVRRLDLSGMADAEARSVIDRAIADVNRACAGTRRIVLVPTEEWSGGADHAAQGDVLVAVEGDERVVVSRVGPHVATQMPLKQLPEFLHRFVNDIAADLANPESDGWNPDITTIRQIAGTLGDTAGSERKKHYWAKNTLESMLRLYRERSADAYVVWLRPVVDKDRLTVYEYYNLPLSHDHYEFKLGEGLAGKVWETGHAAIHSQSHPHPWWVIRKPQKITYICAPVGAPASPDGVLAVGSDRGFEVRPGEAELLSIFATLLRLGACN